MTDLFGYEECPGCGVEEPFNARTPDDEVPGAEYGNCHNCDLPIVVMPAYLPMKKGGQVRHVDLKAWKKGRKTVGA